MSYGVNLLSPSLWFKYFGRRLFSMVPPSAIKNAGFAATGISIGRNAFIGDGVYFIDGFRPGLIELGEGAVLSPRVTVVAAAEPGGSFLPLEYAVSKTARITVGEGAWIGVGAVLLPGISIGRGAIVGANAVVTKDVPEMEVWAGVPARALKSVSDFGRIAVSSH